MGAGEHYRAVGCYVSGRAYGHALYGGDVFCWATFYHGGPALHAAIPQVVTGPDLA